MPGLTIRWSDMEAAKAYARPLMVTFTDDAGAALGSVAVNGRDLLYYRSFQTAVLALSGELFCHAAVEDAADPQHAWLDVLSAALPETGAIFIRPESVFDERAGRSFVFVVECGASRVARVDAPSLLAYQETQAEVAHQCGRLFREEYIETIDDEEARRAAWTRWLTEHLARPDSGDAMAETWPWR